VRQGARAAIYSEAMKSVGAGLFVALMGVTLRVQAGEGDFT
jgi:hypothetical protein